ncbi:MAG: hypothetical protein NUV81_03770 [bacterium]|nr:hypothetical protein [bacterium]
MLPALQQKLDSDQLLSLQQSQADAATKFDAVQVKITEQQDAVIDKIVLYSAGIISLSITFVGSVLEKYASVFNQPVISELPLKYVLFFAWVSLLVSFLAGFIVRWVYPLFFFWNSQLDWKQKRENFLKAKIAYLQKYLTLNPDGRTQEEQKSIEEQNLEKLQGNKAHITEKKEWNWRIYEMAQKTCLVAFGSGIFLLACFALLFVYQATSYPDLPHPQVERSVWEAKPL